MHKLKLRRWVLALSTICVAAIASPTAVQVESMDPLPLSNGYICQLHFHVGGHTCPASDCNHYDWNGYRCAMSGNYNDTCEEFQQSQSVFVIPGTCNGSVCTLQDPSSGYWMNVMVPMCV